VATSCCQATYHCLISISEESPAEFIKWITDVLNITELLQINPNAVNRREKSMAEANLNP
jgi:hypothetical protein